jgi:hypothetical protein
MVRRGSRREIPGENSHVRHRNQEKPIWFEDAMPLYGVESRKTQHRTRHERTGKGGADL